jgi:hypothetical protein
MLNPSASQLIFYGKALIFRCFRKILILDTVKSLNYQLMLKFYLTLLLLPYISVGQYSKTQQNYIKVGNIKDFSEFQKLTKLEKELGKAYDNQNAQTSKVISDEEGLEKLGLNQSMIDTLNHDIKITSSLVYKENRSRNILDVYKDGELISKTDDDKHIEAMGTQCSCNLKNDTITVKMSFWIFGGFAIQIKLMDNQFVGLYSLDERRQYIFKLKNSDELSTNIVIPLAEQQLLLDVKPMYKSGQQLNGYFSFNTEDYFELDVNSTSNSLDNLKTTGTTYFTCKVIETYR